MAAHEHDLERSVAAMEREYPWFTFTPDAPGGRWRGRVQPIQSQEKLEALLDDIHHGRRVHVQGDRVDHLPDCESDHCRHPWMEGLTALDRRFDIEIVCRGDRSVPRCYVDPPIPKRKRNHMWNDGAMCAFLTSEDVWVWNRDTVATLVPHFLFWLIKWMVFDESGVWIGPEHRNDPVYHRQRVGRNDQCWCGSGRKYKRCHLRQEARESTRLRRVATRGSRR